jgi:hypothetical protein
MTVKTMEATRVPIPDVESATPNLDIVRRGAATGQASRLRQYQAVMATDGSPQELEDRATQELEAFELNPARQQYLDEYETDLRRALFNLRETGVDAGNALAGTLSNIRDDITQIPPGTTGPFRDKLVSMYQDFITQQRLERMSDQAKVDEMERDIALATNPQTSFDTALERVRTEGEPREAVPPPSIQGEGIDRHLENVLSTMNAMSDRSRRLHPAEMSVAVQNMRGAPLAATYVQPRDAADPEYMAAVEHELLRTRQLKRRGMRKSRRQ